MGAARRRRRQCAAGRRGADRAQPHRPREAAALLRPDRQSRAIPAPAGERAIDPGRVRPHPARSRQGRRHARRSHRHDLARRDRLDQSRRLGEPARPVPARSDMADVFAKAKIASAQKWSVSEQRPAHRARHRREQPLPDARRGGPLRRPVRRAAGADRHALRSVHRPRPRCAQLRLLPGRALPARRDAERHDARAAKAAPTSRSTRR